MPQFTKGETNAGFLERSDRSLISFLSLKKKEVNILPLWKMQTTLC